MPYKDPKKQREAVKRWRLNHPEKMREIEKAYRLANREKLNAQQKMRYHNNIENVREQQRKWYADNREKRRAQAKVSRQRRRESNRIVNSETGDYRKAMIYGISKIEVAKLYEAHNFRCAICQKEATIDRSGKKRLGLYIDHDHTTGQLRGLLCNRCNLGISYFKECIDLFYRAIEYLGKYSSGWASEMPKGLREICERQAAVDKEARDNALYS